MLSDLSFINNAQKTLKSSKKKCFLGWMRKSSYPGISDEGYWQNHEMEVASKKVCWKNNKVLQTLVTYRHWKRCFFKI